MFRSVFNKVGKVAFNTAKHQSAKQNVIKSSMNGVRSNQQTLKLTASFANSIMYQQMESVSLLERTTPLGNAVALNIQNLREILQKCKQQTQLQSSSSTFGQYLVAVGIIDSNLLCLIDSCKTLTWAHIISCDFIKNSNLRSQLNDECNL